MNLHQKIKEDKILKYISENFDNEIYLVGGAVRDIFLDNHTYDRDLIICDETPEIFAKALAEKLDATLITLDSENEIYRIVLKDKINYLDITKPIENSLEKDLRRRDLTINSVAINIKTGEIIDPNSGINDIKNGIIKMINPENFEDDPLRLLRVFRFEAVTGFKTDKQTTDTVKKLSHLIKKPAKERIVYETMKLFGGEYASQALISADECSILYLIFPFVEELHKVPPNTHHHLDLFHHSIETVNQIQNIYENSPQEIREHLENIDFGGFSRLSHLKLAGFMHDIGKFSTWTIEENGRHRFIKHDDVGAKLAKEFLKTLKFSNKQIEYLSFIIKNHIYPSSVMQSPEITDKLMMRFVRKADLNAIDLITIAKADRLSARGVDITEDIVENNINSLNKLQNFYLEKRKTLKPLPVLLDGNEIMQRFNIKPSKTLGNILNLLHEEQLNGEILTKDEALEFVKNKLNEM